MEITHGSKKKQKQKNILKKDGGTHLSIIQNNKIPSIDILILTSFILKQKRKTDARQEI